MNEQKVRRLKSTNLTFLGDNRGKNIDLESLIEKNEVKVCRLLDEAHPLFFDGIMGNSEMKPPKL